MKPAALYYAKHEDLPKTRLKTPFQPLWIMRSLGLDIIKAPSNAKLENHNGLLRIVFEESSVKRVILIDDKNQSIKGHYLYDSNNILIASVEINESENNLPKKMRVVWIDRGEKIVMDWWFNNIEVNIPIQSSWARPTQYSPQINMAKD